MFEGSYGINIPMFITVNLFVTIQGNSTTFSKILLGKYMHL